MKWIMTVALLMSVFVGLAQKKENKKKGEREVFTSVPQMPEYTAGDIFEFIAMNIVYPAQAMQDGTEGKVYVKFIVSETGELEDIHVEHSISKELDEEALRVIKLMPKWKPGEMNGKKVAVYVMLPVNFRISN